MLFKGFEIRKSLAWPFALGCGALGLGLLLDLILGNGTWDILSGLGGLTVLAIAGTELALRRREHV